MLDQDTDPRAVAEAESADEEQLRHIDFVAAQHRSASLSGAFAQLGGGGELVQQQQQHTASSSPQQYVEIAVTGGGQQLAAQQQQQGRGSVVVSAGGSDSALAEGDQDSLLPGMYGPPGSLLPPVTEWALQVSSALVFSRVFVAAAAENVSVLPARTAAHPSWQTHQTRPSLAACSANRISCYCCWSATLLRASLPPTVLTARLPPPPLLLLPAARRNRNLQAA